MATLRKQIKEKGAWFWAAVSVLLIVTVLFSTQAFSASISVTAQPLQNAGNGDLTYNTDYSAASSVVTRHESSDVTLDGSDLITKIDVQGTKASGGANVQVDLLDASASLLDTATVALPSASGSYNTSVTLAGTVGYFNVTTILATYTAAGSVAIAFDAASSTNGKSSTLTWSHTVGAAGSDRILVVGVSLKTNTVVSGVTYGGQALALVPNSAVVHSGGKRVELWYKVAPLTGANNVVVSMPSSVHMIGGATSWTGVHQTTPLGTAATAALTTGTGTVDVTSVSGDVVVDTLSTASTMTVGAGQTQRWNLSQAGFKGAGSTEDATTTTTTMSWTFVSGDWAITAVPLKQANP